MVADSIHRWGNLRKGCFRALAVIALVLASFSVHATMTTVYAWRVTGNGGSSGNTAFVGTTGATGSEICQAYADYRTSSTSGATFYVFAVTPTGAPTALSQTASCDIDYTVGSTIYKSVTYVPIQSYSYEQSTCADKSGQITVRSESEYEVGAEGCVNGCGVIANAGMTMMFGLLPTETPWVGTATYTGAECTTAGSANEAENPTTASASQDGETCWEWAGHTWCADNGGSEDPSVSVDGVTEQEEGTCASLPDGGMVCTTSYGQTPTTPPAPDSGVEGDPATSDGVITNNITSTTTTVYESTTVENSTNYGTGSGEGGSGSSSSSGSSDSSSSSSTGSGSSSSSSSDGTCTGDNCDFNGPENEEVGTFGETASAFYGRVQSSPLVSAVSGIGANLPAGVCPSGSVQLFGSTITLDIHCTVWDQVSGLLTAVAYAAWAFMGLRIIMSA